MCWYNGERLAHSTFFNVYDVFNVFNGFLHLQQILANRGPDSRFVLEVNIIVKADF